jgi:hypothetical protein
MRFLFLLTIAFYFLAFSLAAVVPAQHRWKRGVEYKGCPKGYFKYCSDGHCTPCEKDQ